MKLYSVNSAFTVTHRWRSRSLWTRSERNWKFIKQMLSNTIHWEHIWNKMHRCHGVFSPEHHLEHLKCCLCPLCHENRDSIRFVVSKYHHSTRVLSHAATYRFIFHWQRWHDMHYVLALSSLYLYHAISYRQNIIRHRVECRMRKENKVVVLHE